MLKVKRNWKGHYRKMPKHLQLCLDDLSASELVRVYAVKVLKREDIKDGVYSHLGIDLDKSGEITYPSIIVPDIIGKFSKYNVLEEEVVRKDLPMENYDISFYAPDWGDFSNGSHLVTWTKERYQRDLIPTHGLQIKIRQVKEGSDTFVFEINRYFEKEDEELFYGINLMQEVVGNSEIQSAGEQLNPESIDLVAWEIFPPGKREEFVNKVLSGVKKSRPERLAETEARLGFIKKLKPKSYIYGITGFDNYFGAKLKEDVVVFENERYGNALYILYQDWAELSQLSRTEVLRKKSSEYNRIFHTGDWEKKASRILELKSGIKI